MLKSVDFDQIFIRDVSRELRFSRFLSTKAYRLYVSMEILKPLTY